MTAGTQSPSEFVCALYSTRRLLLSIKEYLGTGHIGVRSTGKERGANLNRLACTHIQSHQKLAEHLRVFPLRTPFSLLENFNELYKEQREGLLAGQGGEPFFV